MFKVALRGVELKKILAVYCGRKIMIDALEQLAELMMNEDDARELQERAYVEAMDCLTYLYGEDKIPQNFNDFVLFLNLAILEKTEVN